jgi:very-short-patch-repair endonuclease
MAWEIDPETSRAAWALARRQHWVATRQQLLDLGLSARAIEHRMLKGRLHPIHTGVYVVGRPELTRDGHFHAAVLACGEDAALSDRSAAEHWAIVPGRAGPIHVTVPRHRTRRHPGIAVHRRREFATTRHRGVPVTTPVVTLVDLAQELDEMQLERAVNEAVNQDLTDPERLRESAAGLRRRQGARRVLALLDRDTYVVTDSRLEQRFLRIVRRAGLPLPITQRQLQGGRVDFYWPQLGLIVEADSLRYHRTPAQQRADRLRDQKHAAAGLTSLRFTHWQIFFEAQHVEATLAAVARRLAARA